MALSLEGYKTLVFDCDGVVLNSNRVKTDAFYRATLPYGEAAAQAMVEYHTARGGVSRYKKFAHFLEQIVPEIAPDTDGPDLELLLERYAEEVHHGLLACEVTPGLEQLRERTSHVRWLIVSGGDQSELREVFAQRGLAGLFDCGIFGSPDTKDEILARELSSGNIQKPALFLGDSKYDFQAASTAGLDFVFLSDWSEVQDWRMWVSENGLTHARSVQSLFCDA